MPRINNLPADTDLKLTDKVLISDPSGNKTATVQQMVDLVNTGSDYTVNGAFPLQVGNKNYSSPLQYEDFDSYEWEPANTTTADDNIYATSADTLTLGENIANRVFAKDAVAVGSWLVITNTDGDSHFSKINDIDTGDRTIDLTEDMADFSIFDDSNLGSTILFYTGTLLVDNEPLGVEFGDGSGEIATWAEGNNEDAIPANKLTNAPAFITFGDGATDVAAWAEGNSTELMPLDKLGSRWLPNGSVHTQTYRKQGNNDVTSRGPSTMFEENFTTYTLGARDASQSENLYVNQSQNDELIIGDDLQTDLLAVPNFESNLNRDHLVVFMRNSTGKEISARIEPDGIDVNAKTITLEEAVPGTDASDFDGLNNLPYEIIFSGSDNLAIRNALDISGNLDVAGAATFDDITVGGEITDSNDTTGSANQFLKAGDSGVEWSDIEQTNSDFTIKSSDATLTLDDTTSGDNASGSIIFSHGDNGHVAEIQGRGISTDDSDKQGELDIKVWRDHDVVPRLRDALSFGQTSTSFFFGANTIPTLNLNSRNLDLWTDADDSLDDSFNLTLRRATTQAGAEIGALNMVNETTGDDYQSRIVTKKTFAGLDERGTLEFEVRSSTALNKVATFENNEIDFHVPIQTVHQDGPSIVLTMDEDELSELAFVKAPASNSQEMGDIVWYNNDGTSPFGNNELTDSERRGILRLDRNAGTHEFKFYTGSPVGLRATISSAGLKLGTGTNPLTNSGIGNIPSHNESGTFTPASNEITMGTDTAGAYTRVGNIVTCWVELEFPTNTNTANVSLTGLPFDPSHDGTVCVMNDFNNSDNNTHMLHLFVNGRMGIYRNNSRLTHANVTGRHFRAWFSYVTT